MSALNTPPANQIDIQTPSPEQRSLGNVLSERAITPGIIDNHSNIKNMNRGQGLSRRKSLLGSNSESKMNILGLKRQFSLDNNFMLGSAGKMKTTTPKDIQPYPMSPLGNMN